jgi:trigger factor
MKTSVTELGDSRVRVDVGIEPDAVESRLDRAARSMAREMRMPGFRKGKVPPQLVIQRVGRDAVLEQALRDSLPEWYERALLEAGITPVGDPQLSVPSIPGAGEELEFSIEVAVRPKAKLGEYKGLEVGRAEPEVPEEAIQAELDRLREGFASLKTVDRPARAGDLVLIDYAGTVDGEPFEGSEATDLMVELGAESLLPEFDEALEGASAVDELAVEVSFPDDHRPEALAGKQARFIVTVKEVREKELPELDDDFASEASEFETLDELREEIRTRLAAAFERRAEDEFREAAVDAAAAAAQIELPKELVHARAHEMWDRVERSLASRGINPQTYTQMQGKTREELITDLESDAERALRREATLAAIADAEQIEVTDDDLLAALGPGEGDQTPERLLERLRESGRDALLRSELRLRKAADVIAESAKPIALEQAEARERLWTPEKEGAAKGGEAGLWTPGEG